MALALLEVGVLGIALGTLLGLVASREFEASMLIVAVCGIQMALGRSGSDAERYLLFWPPVEAMRTAGFSASPEVWRFLALGAGHAMALLAAGYAVWWWRTRVWGDSPAQTRTLRCPRSGSGRAGPG